LYKNKVFFINIYKYYRIYYKKIAVASLSLPDFRKFIEIDKNAMNEALLPVTMKQISEIAQEYLGKYCRNYVERRFRSYITSGSIPDKNLSYTLPHSESTLKRFIKQLSQEIPKGPDFIDSFYSHFTDSESNIASLYEELVFFHNSYY